MPWVNRPTINRRAFAVAAIVSVVTVVVLFGFLIIGGLFISLAGGVALAAKKHRPTGTALSVGLGLLVGPVLYLALGGIVYLAEVSR
jgi:hypothetical protein